MPIELKKIQTWEEKAAGWPVGTVRLYIANLQLGTCEPVRGIDEDRYTFDNFYPSIIDLSISTVNGHTLDFIIDQCELSLKEFAKKILK